MSFFGESGALDAIDAEIDAEIDDGRGSAGQAGVDLHAVDAFAVVADVRRVSILDDPAVTTNPGNDELELDRAVVGVGVGFSL